MSNEDAIQPKAADDGTANNGVENDGVANDSAANDSAGSDQAAVTPKTTEPAAVTTPEPLLAPEPMAATEEPSASTPSTSAVPVDRPQSDPQPPALLTSVPELKPEAPEPALAPEEPATPPSQTIASPPSPLSSPPKPASAGFATVTSAPSPSSPRPRARIFTYAALVVVTVLITVLALQYLVPLFGRYRDGRAIDASARSVTPRLILWEAPTALELGLPPGIECYEPTFSPDGLCMIFVQGKATHNADLFMTKQVRGTWSPPVPLRAINTPHDELGAALTRDGNGLYFSSNRPGGLGGYDIWLSLRQGNGWGEPVNLGAAINTEYNEYTPDIASDGSTLYLCSNRAKPEHEGTEQKTTWQATLRENFDASDYDIFAAKSRNGAATDFEPAMRVEVLNSPAHEGKAALSPRGDFLYFTSNRPGGQGGFDLYRSHIVNGTCAAPENLGTTINGPHDDMDPALLFEGHGLVLSSNRIPGPASRPFTLMRSTSREVFAASDLSALAAWFDWILHNAWLIGVLLAALLALLWLARAMRSPRVRGNLSLIQRCLLASLMLHALLALLFTTWAVSTGYFEQEGDDQGAFVHADALVSDRLTMAIREQTATFVSTPVSDARTDAPAHDTLHLEAPTTLPDAPMQAGDDQHADVPRLENTEHLMRPPADDRLAASSGVDHAAAAHDEQSARVVVMAPDAASLAQPTVRQTRPESKHEPDSTLDAPISHASSDQPRAHHVSSEATALSLTLPVSDTSHAALSSSAEAALPQASGLPEEAAAPTSTSRHHEELSSWRHDEPVQTQSDPPVVIESAAPKALVDPDTPRHPRSEAMSQMKTLMDDNARARERRVQLELSPGVIPQLPVAQAESSPAPACPVVLLPMEHPELDHLHDDAVLGRFVQETPLTYHGIPVTRKRLIFVLDVSRSMEWGNRIGLAKAELIRMLEALRDDKVEFNVLAFAGAVEAWSAVGLVPASPENVAAAKAYINALELRDDGTNTFGALNEALGDQRVQSIYFLSDGHPTRGTVLDTPGILRGLAQKMVKHTPAIHTIAFLKGQVPPQWRAKVPPKATLIDLMQKIAELSQGMAVVIDDEAASAPARPKSGDSGTF